jgi:hypothetical protein
MPISEVKERRERQGEKEGVEEKVKGVELHTESGNVKGLGIGG